MNQCDCCVDPGGDVYSPTICKGYQTPKSCCDGRTPISSDGKMICPPKTPSYDLFGVY
jgi:hypothetical protein